jgi:hypothetical protein
MHLVIFSLLYHSPKSLLWRMDFPITLTKVVLGFCSKKLSQSTSDVCHEFREIVLGHFSNLVDSCWRTILIGTINLCIKEKYLCHSVDHSRLQEKMFP